MKYAIVLAGGKGTRMQSNKSKVMHEILHKPMIGHLVDHLEMIDTDKIVVVTGHQHEEVEAYLNGRVEIAYQEEQYGTGDAVSRVNQLRGLEGSTLIVLGDCALIQPESLANIFEKHQGNDLTVLSAKVAQPANYRRIVRDNQGYIDRIVDYRTLTEAEQAINEISLGIYCVNNKLLFKYLDEIKDDPATDEVNIIKLAEIMKKNGHKIQSLRVDDPEEYFGVNDRMQLLKASQWLQQKVNLKHMVNGVTIMDPNTTYISTEVTIDADAIIYPNNHIYGKTSIGAETEILPNCWIENATIGKKTVIESSKIMNTTIHNNVVVGPNSHLRMNSVVEDGCRIGNFVEFKNTFFSEGSKCSHLVYLGDTKVGKNVNIGCGVVTVNYDGKHKYQTSIGNNAFIGSNSNLIAPITIGNDAVIAAGSTVNQNVENGALAIARSRQENKPGYGTKYISKEGK